MAKLTIGTATVPPSGLIGEGPFDGYKVIWRLLFRSFGGWQLMFGIKYGTFSHLE